MGKKIYVPTMDELYLMQDMGANIYKYLLVKAIESLIIEGINYPNKGILKNAYKYLRENPNISYAICSMFPEEIESSECAKYDVKLCQELLRTKEDNISRLDNLSYFAPNVQTNISVVNNIITILGKELPNNPKYRFTYRRNKILDNIFGVNIEDLKLLLNSQEIYEYLTEIEPAYALKLIQREKNKKIVLNEGLSAYAQRYNIDVYAGYEYKGKDILTNPDTNVKRLIRCINQNKKNLY